MRKKQSAVDLFIPAQGLRGSRVWPPRPRGTQHNTTGRAFKQPAETTTRTSDVYRSSASSRLIISPIFWGVQCPV